MQKESLTKKPWFLPVLITLVILAAILAFPSVSFNSFSQQTFSSAHSLPFSFLSKDSRMSPPISLDTEKNMLQFQTKKTSSCIHPITGKPIPQGRYIIGECNGNCQRNKFRCNNGRWDFITSETCINRDPCYGPCNKEKCTQESGQCGIPQGEKVIKCIYDGKRSCGETDCIVGDEDCTASKCKDIQPGKKCGEEGECKARGNPIECTGQICGYGNCDNSCTNALLMRCNSEKKCEETSQTTLCVPGLLCGESFCDNDCNAFDRVCMRSSEGLSCQQDSTRLLSCENLFCNNGQGTCKPCTYDPNVICCKPNPIITPSTTQSTTNPSLTLEDQIQTTQ